jgi:hypothetical protein
MVDDAEGGHGCWLWSEILGHNGFIASASVKIPRHVTLFYASRAKRILGRTVKLGAANRIFPVVKATLLYSIF